MTSSAHAFRPIHASYLVRDQLWLESHTWIRTPVVLAGDLLQSNLRYELVVGFTRLGNLLGALDWLDPTAQHRQELVQPAFPNRTVTLYGWTEDGNKTLAYVASSSMARLLLG